MAFSITLSDVEWALVSDLFSRSRGHGVDLTAPMTEAPSKLVVDSEPAG